MKKQIYDEKNGMSYTLHGDYYLPDLVLNEGRTYIWKIWNVTKAVLKRTQISKVSVFVIDWKAE